MVATPDTAAEASPVRTLIPTVRGVLGDLRRSAQRSDVMVVAAAMTTYAAFGLVPLAAIGVRVASGVYGPGRVSGAARTLARYLRGPLHLDRDVVAFTHAAATTGWWTVLLALLPVSLYSEGIVRSLERFSRARERHSRAVRGRLLTPVLTLLAVLVVVLLAGPARPLLAPFGTGTGARLLGIFLGFNLLFFPVFGALLLVYRLFATTPLRRGPLLLGAFVAASWISGQLIGYTLALRLISGFANAFGGYAPAGTIAALAFLIYLEHLVFVLGYLLALVLHERGRAQPTSTTTGRWSDTAEAGVDDRTAASKEPRSSA